MWYVSSYCGVTLRIKIERPEYNHYWYKMRSSLMWIDAPSFYIPRY